jgi:Domain of unknown function (DUF4157)
MRQQRAKGASALTPVPLALVLPKCACGRSAGGNGECDSCRQHRETRGRETAGSFLPLNRVLTIVHDVLRAPGQPLDRSAREFMESRFGRDFSQVRTHTDERANRSAQTLQARAYTVGHNIVFASGENAAGTGQGTQLLAHELTHVVQQTTGADGSLGLSSMEAAEQEAETTSSVIVQDGSATPAAPVPFGAVQRQRNPLDDTAKAIIAAAEDEKTPADKRAVQLVKDIIANYYSGDAAKVESVVFDNAAAGSGLGTQSVGSGAGTKGKISVGNDFLAQVKSFARRVLQVGHELQHIEQYRTGLAGGQHKNLREFLAFHDEALASEKAGTGRVSYSTRLALIDGALGYYYCLTGDEQKARESRKETLLERRAEVNGKAGNDPKDPPTTCKKQ